MQPISNMDLVYLIMVGVFLLAGVLLMFRNRKRENMETGPAGDAKAVPEGESHPLPGPPEIQRQNTIDASGEDKLTEKMWYYSIDGISKHGPITEGELQQLLASRRLLPDTLVWTRELPCWSNASSCDLLTSSQRSV
ncbi:MAG TPA: DUF4339 domain-containing protein [Syntrophales bacterium]|nr:DUF4339 domain-containing protein [Smithellaceae bacterium]HPN08410.1 DUF4339 domain-containing protein [Syntrophales bacterium]HPX80870.1 DUF4339 domain-containing protein [Syntrophales bacterium]HQB13171.1 DUF4339 domain-containing protein [Syntrophales bacterium]